MRPVIPSIYPSRSAPITCLPCPSPITSTHRPTLPTHRFEPYHDSPLARFLIERSLRSPILVGHPFVWHLKAELSCPEFCERYALVLECYLAHSGPHSSLVRAQNTIVARFQQMAEMIKINKHENKISDQQCTKQYHEELEKLNNGYIKKIGKFQVPFNPRVFARSINVNKCKFMDSKMKPLWLIFDNVDDKCDPIQAIFKSGDDLRQDILTLQLLRIMDKVGHSVSVG